MTDIQIPEISYPLEYMEDLMRLTPLITETIKRDGLPIKSGEINLGKLDLRLEIAHFYLSWISECNEVIGNLNLTLADLRALPERLHILGGLPWSRYKLLVRTFFHEFYRLREIFNTALSISVKRGFMTKSEQQLARNAFHDVIQEAIDLRNSLVHGRVSWSGEEHIELHLLSFARASGHRLVHRETGNEVSLERKLQQTCMKMVAVLQPEGVKVSTIMSAFVRESVHLTSKL